MDKVTPIHEQIAEYIVYCERVRVMSEQTMKSKYHIFKHFEEDCGVNDLKDFDNQKMNKWIANQVASGIAGRTVNGRMNHVVAMIKYHREMGMMIPIKLPLIQKVPEMPPKRKFYSREQIAEVIKHADDVSGLLIRIAFDTGMRISELTNLQLSDFSGSRINYIGKGKKGRQSFICPDTLAELQKYCLKNNIKRYLWPSPVVFGGEKPYNVCEIRRIMRVPFYAAGYNDFYPHSLRHSFGTDIQRSGATIAEAQQLLGHSKIETTERYLHCLDNQLEELFLKLKLPIYS